MPQKTVSSLIPVRDFQCLYNTRFKYYPGFTKISCFSKEIFNPDGYELCTPDGTQRKVLLPNKDKKRERKGTQARGDSVKRARDKSFDIAHMNKFDYFITFTLSLEHINRYDVVEILRVFKNWLDNNSRRRELKYLIFPEYHFDGAIHFHGFISGNLDMRFSGMYTLRGQQIFNCVNWTLGFTSAVKIDAEYERIINYCMKYVTKDSKKIFGNHYFAGGKGLIREVPTEYVNVEFDDFDGDYYKIPNCPMSVKYKTIAEDF